MSLGSNYNNEKKSNVFDPMVYTPYRMNNAESMVDKTCITFSYWKNVLKITIAPKKDTGNDETVFDMDNGISIYLSHSKARILADVMRKFLADPEKWDNSGVPAGQGLITISRGKEFNSQHPLMIIRKIDQSGNVISSFAYEFKTNYFFAVNNYQENGSFNKIFDTYNTLEIEQMITLLEEYYKAMTCATAYSVVDQMKFAENRVSTKLGKIAEKLGVELGGSGNGSRSYNNSYFNNNGTTQPSSDSSNGGGYTHATLDDIE